MLLDELFICLRGGVGMFLVLYVEDKVGLKIGNYSNYKGLFLF